jgi:putative addiction module component (TIGR02574 family)
MSVSADVFTLALEMPEDQRADLALRLIQSLDRAPADPDRGAAWTVEIERRLRDIDEGRAVLIPWDEASKRLEDSLNRYRQS